MRTQNLSRFTLASLGFGLLFATALQSGCGAPEIEGAIEQEGQALVSDIGSITLRPDGRYDVICKDWRREVRTAAQITANDVCNPATVLGDPFDPTSCSETSSSSAKLTLANAAKLIGAGETEGKVGNFNTVSRYRKCNTLGTCSPWSTAFPTDMAPKTFVPYAYTYFSYPTPPAIRYLDVGRTGELWLRTDVTSSPKIMFHFESAQFTTALGDGAVKQVGLMGSQQIVSPAAYREGFTIWNQAYRYTSDRGARFSSYTGTKGKPADLVGVYGGLSSDITTTCFRLQLNESHDRGDGSNYEVQTVVYGTVGVP